jgi:hypothetical protein
MEIATGEMTQALGVRIFIECFEGVGIDEHGIFERERAGFIEDDLAQPCEFFPEAKRAHKDAMTSARLAAMSSASGAATPRAQGQDTTKTEIMTCMALVQSPVCCHHQMPPMTPASTTTIR